MTSLKPDFIVFKIECFIECEPKYAIVRKTGILNKNSIVGGCLTAWGKVTDSQTLTLTMEDLLLSHETEHTSQERKV